MKMRLNSQNSQGSISVVIPKAIREALNWKAGMDVDVKLDTDTKEVRIKDYNESNNS